MAEVAKDVANRKGSGSAKELFEFIKKVCTGQECVPGRNVYRAEECLVHPSERYFLFYLTVLFLNCFSGTQRTAGGELRDLAICSTLQ